MYRTIIKLKREIAPEQLRSLTRMVIDNFNNRAGMLENHSTNPYEFIFEGNGESAFACLDLGVSTLACTNFLDNVFSWDWIDEEDPFENCDIKELYERRKKEICK